MLDVGGQLCFNSLAHHFARHTFGPLVDKGAPSIHSSEKKRAFQQISCEVLMAKIATQNPECQICGKQVSAQSELEDHIVESHPDAISPAIWNRYNQRRCGPGAGTAGITAPSPVKSPHLPPRAALHS
jgi:hypothetical protein